MSHHVSCTLVMSRGGLIVKTMFDVEIAFAQDSQDIYAILDHCILTPAEKHDLWRGWTIESAMYDEMYWEFYRNTSDVPEIIDMGDGDLVCCN